MRCIRCRRWPALYEMRRAESSLDRVEGNAHILGSAHVGMACGRCRDALSYDLMEAWGGSSSTPTGILLWLYYRRYDLMTRLHLWPHDEPPEPDDGTPALYL